MKTVQEWSLKFDQVYNNIASNKAPGLNLYEKSVFLTDAQKLVVIALYQGQLGKGFESDEEIANYLSPLVRQGQGILCEDNPEAVPPIIYPRIAGDKSYVYSLPEDLMFRTFEFCTVDDPACNKTVGQTTVYPTALVQPVTQDEYWRTSRNPFKKQNSRRVLRLIYSKSSDSEGTMSSEKYTELISDYEVKGYTVRYIKYPDPIILSQLPSTLKIEGKNQPCSCQLDEALHDVILNKAVELAKNAWTA